MIVCITVSCQNDGGYVVSRACSLLLQCACPSAVALLTTRSECGSERVNLMDESLCLGGLP